MFNLKSIHVENFMSLETLDMEFDDEFIMAITGQNGSGKSSLLYAIALCLTGYRKGESYRDYVKIGEDTAIIQLKAFFKGKPILYEVELYGNKKSGSPTKKKVTYEGIEYLNSDYSQFIKKYELEDLESLMFMFQGSRDIIDTRPAERAAMLKKLFRFEFDDIVSQIKSEQEQLKISNIEYSTLSSELRTRTFEKQKLLREKLPSVISGWEQRISEISNSLDQLREVDDSSISKCERELNDIQRKISAEILKTKTTEKSIKDIENKLSGIIEYLGSNQEEELQNNIQSLNQKLEDHKSCYDNLKKEYVNKNSKLNILNYKLKELTEQIKICETGVCHSCGQPITPEHVRNLIDSQESLNNDISLLNDEISSLNFDPNDLESNKILKEIRQTENTLKEYKQAQDDKDVYEERLRNTEEVLSYAKTYIENLENNEKKLSEEKERLNELKPLLKQKGDLLTEKENLESEINTAKEVVITNVERKKTNALIEKEENERDQKLQEYSDKINNIEMSLIEDKTIIDIFENKFPTYITLQACIQLENYVNEIIQKIFPYCKVSLRLSRGGVNFFYTVDESKGEWLAVSMASGAQKDVLSLAYQIGLARMYNIKCICLDEIDAACSDENANLVYNLIAGLDCFDQIIFISHRQESIKAVKSLNSDAIIYCVEDGDYIIAE